MRCNPNAGDHSWKTGVHHAAENGHLEVLEVLDDFAADFSATTIKGETAIHLAARKGKSNVSKFCPLITIVKFNFWPFFYFINNPVTFF
jgi:ankyrin repeat protein